MSFATIPHGKFLCNGRKLFNGIGVADLGAVDAVGLSQHPFDRIQVSVTHAPYVRGRLSGVKLKSVADIEDIPKGRIGRVCPVDKGYAF